MEHYYKSCNLCARHCAVDRISGVSGACGMSSEIKIARAALHFWEEPPISADRGSGAIFFSGCSLGCIYCQNREISKGESGSSVSCSRLAEIMLELSSQGAHNINLVTPTHYVPSIIRAVKLAREKGLGIPIVYNTASYETSETVRMLRGTVDIFLPDLKYYKGETAKKYSNANNYPEVARAAIDEMVNIAPTPSFDECGVMKSGVIVRLLLLPGHLAEAKLNLKYLFDRYKDRILISLMSQYTPIGNMPGTLSRRVTKEEYRQLVDYAIKLGVKNAFVQDAESAKESFIPAFDNTGVIKAL